MVVAAHPYVTQVEATGDPAASLGINRLFLMALLLTPTRPRSWRLNDGCPSACSTKLCAGFGELGFMSGAAQGFGGSPQEGHPPPESTLLFACPVALCFSAAPRPCSTTSCSPDRARSPVSYPKGYETSARLRTLQDTRANLEPDGCLQIQFSNSRSEKISPFGT